MNKLSNETFSIENMAFDLPTLELDPIETEQTEVPGGEPATSVTSGIAGVAPPTPVNPLGFAEPDLLWLSKLVSNGPTILFDKLPRIEDELINDVNSEFYKYCIRKNINPWDYLFDELPLLGVLVPIAMIHWRNYQAIYVDQEKVDKLDKDYVNAKEIDDKEQGEE